MTSPVLRTATPFEVEMVSGWAAAEGWNPGIDDARAFHASDPQGFFMAEIEGSPVASISVVNHSADFAFLGLYICRPEFRGRGIGYALWSHALAHAGDRTIGLDGVAAQEANYARSGFVRKGSTIRMEGELSPQADSRISSAEVTDMQALLVLDHSANGVSRSHFLKAWLAPKKTRRSVVLRNAGHIVGFATIRRCRDGVKIGPVVAESAVDALALARAGLESFPATRVIFDIPSENSALSEKLKRAGFSETFSTARMYRGKAPQGSGILQCIATMELG